MRSDTTTMYAKMPPWRLFFKVALPGMVSMFTMSLYSVLEGIFLGQIIGGSALAAINIAFPIVLINFSIADLIGVGSSAPISIALGRRDEDRANNIFSSSIVLIFIASVITGAVMFFAAEPLSRLMGADEDVLGTATQYIRTYALCSPLTTVFFAMDNYLRISGYIKTSMFINIFCNGATIVLLVLFLLVFDMGAAGSALAACISMCISSMLALIPFIRGKALLRFVRPRITLSLVKQIAACGSPTFLNNIAGRVTSILLNVSLSVLGAATFGEGGGTVAIAAYSVLMYASDMCQPLIYGMNDSLAPAIGFNLGAGDHGRVKSIMKCNLIGAFVVGALGASLMFFFPDFIARMFIESSDAQLIALASHAMRIFSVSYLVRWFSLTAQSFLSAIEKPVHATVLSVCVALVFPVIMLAALWGLGLDGVWLNMLGVSVLAAVLGVVLIRSAFRRMEHKDDVIK